MAQERHLLIVSPDESIRRLARSFRGVGWVVDTASHLAKGMRMIEAGPEDYDLVIMDDNHGTDNGTFRDVLSGLGEIRRFNEECKIFLLVTLKERSKADIQSLKGLVHAIIAKNDGFTTMFARSAQFFRYQVQ